MAGLVFHYDRYATSPCEAATLCSGGASVGVEILVSPSNYKNMERLYHNDIAGQKQNKLKIKPLYLKSSHLNAERIQKFMACGNGTKPLYMSAVEKILRQIGIENQGPQARVIKAFSYVDFKSRLGKENFTPLQREPLELRLSLLESYMKPVPLTQNQQPSPSQQPSHTQKSWKLKKQSQGQKPSQSQTKAESRFAPDEFIEDSLVGRAGCMKVVDLTDPHLDTDGACALFNVCLAVFIKETGGPKVIALDEAHNYLGESNGSNEFTNDLLKVVREKRHNGSRIIVATQEPNVSPKLLDLCSMTIVHRFTSPDWFRTLRGHLGGVSAEAGVDEEQARLIFRDIGNLAVGESKLFAPTALLDVGDGREQSLGFDCRTMKTRMRLSDDGGASKIAQNQ